MNIRIVTDSTCDLPEEIVRQQQITVIPLYINVGEESYLDGVNLTRAEFYAQLPNYFPAPKTATPSIETFIQAYEHLADEGAQTILSSSRKAWTWFNWFLSRRPNRHVQTRP